MALGTPTYPTSLDTSATLGPTSGIVAGTTALSAVGANQGDQLGITNNLINQVISVETLVGITNSTVTTTHEYRIRRNFWKVWVVGLEGSPPATNYGIFVVRNNRPLLAFPTAVTSTTLLFGRVPWGMILTSGIVLRYTWMAATATTGNVVWKAGIERMNTDQDTDSFDTLGTVTTATSATSGIAVESVITLATIDSMVAGDAFCLSVQRVGGGSDTMAGDAQLQLVSIENAL